MKQISKDKIRTAFGEAVKGQRECLQATQEELAERAELHRTYLADIERGSRNPSLESIRRIAIALELSISELFQRAEEK